jgi:hypothetical protein
MPKAVLLCMRTLLPSLQASDVAHQSFFFLPF